MILAKSALLNPIYRWAAAGGVTLPPRGFEVRLRNRVYHFCWDGCMYKLDEMMDQQTWNDILDIMVAARNEMIRRGLPLKLAPKIHCSTWQGHVGRGADTELGEVVPFKKMLELIIAARSASGERFEGIDLMEMACVSFDMADDEFNELVALLKANDMVVGDIVAMIWPTEKGQGGAYGSDDDRQRMVDAVERACKLAKRFEAAGVRHYGRIRVDSAAGPDDFHSDEATNYPRLIQTFQDMCDKAAEYTWDAGSPVFEEGDVMEIVAEGEAWCAMLNGHRNTLKLHRDVDRPNFYFQADTAHLVHFIAGQNGGPEDRLLPEHVVPRVPDADDLAADPLAVEATAEQMEFAFEILIPMIASITGSVHAGQSLGGLFGSGSHDKTGKHETANVEGAKVNIVKVIADLMLETVAISA